MKDFHLKILAIIMIIFGIFGLSTLPFLSIIVQYIDSITGFSSPYMVINIPKVV